MFYKQRIAAKYGLDEQHQQCQQTPQAQTRRNSSHHTHASTSLKPQKFSPRLHPRPTSHDSFPSPLSKALPQTPQHTRRLGLIRKASLAGSSGCIGRVTFLAMETGELLAGGDGGLWMG